MDKTKKVRKRRLSFLMGLFLLLLGVFLILNLLFGSFSFERFMPTFQSSVGLIEVTGRIDVIDEYINALRKFGDDPLVKAIVVRIESPVDLRGPTQEIYDEIFRIRTVRNKPVIASLGNTAASGGYYIAAAANEIFAHPSTTTGSIGVILSLSNFEELAKKVGVEVEIVKSGKFKDIGSPTRQMTDEERRVLKSVIDDVYDQFVHDIVSTRGESCYSAMKSSNSLGPIKVEGDEKVSSPTLFNRYISNICDGRIFSGRQAFDLGLVDHLGGLEEAVRYAGSLVGIKDPSPRVVKVKRRASLFGLFFGGARSAVERVKWSEISIEYRLALGK